MLYMIADIAYFAVIVLHLYFAIFEMALWKKMAPKVFGVTPEFAAASAGLASNQGLYNLFIVAALLIGFFSPIIDINVYFMSFGLCCAIAAGLWGGITVNRRIFFVQALPAMVALASRLLLTV